MNNVSETGLPDEGDRIQSPKRCVLNKKRTIDNVQKHNYYIKIFVFLEKDIT
jgi:hypothetical protein